MHGSWFLLFFMVHAGNLIKVLDGSLQGWIEQDTPTCEELREFWNVVTRSVKASESTNEIPLIPLEVFSYAEGIHRQKGRKKHFRPSYPSQKNSLQDIFFEDHRLPSYPKDVLPSSKEHPFYMPHPTTTQTDHDSASAYGGGVFGRFESTPRFGEWSEVSSNVLSGTKKKGGSEMNHAPSWGVPEEVGMFGRFVDFEEGLPLISRHPSSGPNSQGTWPEQRHGPSTQDLLISKEACNEVANKHCTLDEECECSGWSNLRCQRGKCRSHSGNKGQENEFGYWHEASLPSSKLGLFKRSQRSTKSIFM